MHRRPLPLRKNRLFSIRFLVRHVIRHPSQRGGEWDDVSAGCGVRRRDGWHFRLFDLWPSTNGLFSRQLNTISFENVNDSELTYGIILTNFGIAFAFALPRFTQLKCKHKRKCKQKEITFFLFLASALGWPLGFLFPFHTQPKKTLGTGLIYTCCVELRYGCCVVLCLHLRRVQAPHRKQRPQRFMGHFQRCIFVLYFVPAFTKYRRNKKFLQKSFS